jgi:undecaprenyl diphosphate synthase
VTVDLPGSASAPALPSVARTVRATGLLKEQLLADGNIPRHIAIIMDGNGRWARRRGLERVRGHEAAKRAVREAIEGCVELGVEVLTLYTFSIENWQRPRHEVATLMRLLREVLLEERDNLRKNDVRLRISGRIEDLPKYVRLVIDATQHHLRHARSMTLNLALSYGGRGEIVDAVRGIAREVRAGRIRPEQIDEELFRRYLYTADLPDPDLLIRTSGEMRLSNFLLWQLAYAELWVTDVLWPDFRKRHLFLACASYQRRERRFGRVR